MSRPGTMSRRSFTSGAFSSAAIPSGAFSSDTDFLGGLAQIIAGAHGMTVGARVREHQDVAFARRGQQAIVAEHIRALADRTDDIHEVGRGLREPREVRDLVIGPVKRRSYQRVHPGCDPDVFEIDLALHLR